MLFTALDQERLNMYDDFDDYFYPAEDNYHEDMLMQEAEDFYNDFYGDDLIDTDDDLENLLDELEYPFWTPSTLELFAAMVSQ